MIRFFRGLYIGNRLYLFLAVVIGTFMFSFAFSFLFLQGIVLLALLLILISADAFLLFRKSTIIVCKRTIQAVFSLGEQNDITLTLENQSKMAFSFIIYDEQPPEFQARDFSLKGRLQQQEKKVFKYSVRPTARGQFRFGNTNIFVRSALGLLERRLIADNAETFDVYPSLFEMRKHEIRQMELTSNRSGEKKMRKLGHSYEFDQIKDYVTGNDLRAINWKATGRRNKIMVNHYIEEKSQQVYFLIDKSRVMRMPFDNLSLLDYAVNSIFALANIAIKKGDKAGLFTFSNTTDCIVKAGRGKNQLSEILKSLYNIADYNLEANYEMLFLSVKHIVKTRSLLFLYSNFESMYGLYRVLPILKRLNKHHLLVCIFFENTEISSYCSESAANLEEIYTKAFAEQALLEKKQISIELQRHGIQSIFTKPRDLSVLSINKYLELKSRGLA